MTVRGRLISGYLKKKRPFYGSVFIIDDPEDKVFGSDACMPAKEGLLSVIAKKKSAVPFLSN